LEDSELSDENRKNLMKALKAEREVQEILGLAKELRDIDHPRELTSHDLNKVLEHVLKNISDLADLEGVKIHEIYSDSIIKVKGEYSLHNLFSRLLKCRLLIPNCSEIWIDVKGYEEEVLVVIEDDGEPIPQDLKDLLSGDIYTGDTAGVGGARYYMIRQLANYNDVDIKAKDSRKGGARFEVRLMREFNNEI